MHKNKKIKKTRGGKHFSGFARREKKEQKQIKLLQPTFISCFLVVAQLKVVMHKKRNVAIAVLLMHAKTIFLKYIYCFGIPVNMSLREKKRKPQPCKEQNILSG